MLSIFRTKPLDQAFNLTKYKNLLEKDYKDILLFEIEANAHSYSMNQRITERGSKRYSGGVGLTIIALIGSIVLLTANKFIIIEQVPTKVLVVPVSRTVVDYINNATHMAPVSPLLPAQKRK